MKCDYDGLAAAKWLVYSPDHSGYVALCDHDMTAHPAPAGWLAIPASPEDMPATNITFDAPESERWPSRDSELDRIMLMVDPFALIPWL